MLDATGKAIWLVVRSEADMQSFYELARDEDERSPLTQALKKRRKIVFFRQPDYRLTDIKQWVVKDAITLKPRQIYYALFKETQGYQLDKPNLKSYQQFLHAD